jgi:4-aminobutyrate aminotransferase-like enzyme
VACAATLATLDIMVRDKLTTHAAAHGDDLLRAL